MKFVKPLTPAVNTETVITAMDAFIERFADPQRLTLVFMDNARIHHSEWFQAQRERWLLKRVVVCYLPTYSPELNLIEILWRKLKYEWLPLTAYRSFDHLKAAVSQVRCSRKTILSGR
jgi:transposase